MGKMDKKENGNALRRNISAMIWQEQSGFYKNNPTELSKDLYQLLEIATTVREESTYNKVKRLHTRWCIKCEHDNGKQSMDNCFSCQWHILFNKIYDGLNGK